MVGFVLTGLKCAIIVNAPPSQRFVKKKKSDKHNYSKRYFKHIKKLETI